jgi:hypothetical protein
MRTYKIKGNKYTVKRLTIEDYYALKMNIYMNDHENSFAVVSNLTGCPEKDLKTIPYADWLELLVDVQTQINAALSDRGEELKTTFIHEDTVYGMLNLNECTIGEFIDLDIIISSPEAEARLHEVMAILFRPVEDIDEHPYRIQPYDADSSAKRAESFRRMDLYQARKALGFFLDFARVSFEHTVESSIQLMAESQMITPDRINQIRKILYELHEAGMGLSSQSHLRIPSDLIKPANSTTKQPSTSSRTRSMKLDNKNEGWQRFLKNTGHN